MGQITALPKLVLFSSWLVTFGHAQDFYYPDYNAPDLQQQMFIPGASVPSYFAPFTIAILNLSYCDPVRLMIDRMDPVYKRMTRERNIRLNYTCEYSAPTSIAAAIDLYKQLEAIKLEANGVDALLGDYNPLVSTMAESLNITFLIVSMESTSLNQRLQYIGSLLAQTVSSGGSSSSSSSGSGSGSGSGSNSSVGPFADLNDNTFVVDSFWYRSFLFSSILASTPAGFEQTVFGSDFSKFGRLGIICDDAVLLSQFITINRGPVITYIYTTQLDGLYPPESDKLNNASAIESAVLFDSWTSAYANGNVNALLISCNTTYSVSILPRILQSLLNTGFFTPDTLTVMTNLYIPMTSFLAYSDTQSSLYFAAGTAAFGTYTQPFPSVNITVGLQQGLIAQEPLEFDPTASTISAALYFLSMNLIQMVYKPSYISYVIAQQNWPGIIRQSGFLRYAIRYGVAMQQYNRCQYVQQVIGVTPMNCSAADYAQPLYNVVGYWNGINLLYSDDDMFTPVSTTTAPNTNTNTTTTTAPTTSVVSNTPLLNQSLMIGLVADYPFVIPCEECALGYEGYAVDIIGNLSKTEKFSYTFVLFHSYSAMFGELSAGTLDAGIGGMLWSSNATQYGYKIQLTPPDLTSGVNLLMRNNTSIKWWTWTSPFSYQLWFTFLVLMILLIFFFMLLDFIDPNRLGKRLFDFFASYWFVFGSFTQSSVEIMPITISVKLLSMVMWFSVIIFVSAFTAAYSSFLLDQSVSTFVSTVPEALAYYQSTSTPFYFVANSTAATYLASAYPSLYAAAMSEPSVYVVNDALSAMGKMLKSSSTISAFLGDARVNQWMSNLVDCWLVTVGDIDGVNQTYYSTIALPANSSYYTQLKVGLINLRRLRMMTAAKEYYFDSQCTGSSIPQPLDLLNLAGLYIVLGVGCGVSVVSALFEVFVKKARLRTERMTVQRQEPFRFGQSYYAKILIVQESGVLVKVYRSEKDLLRAEAGKKIDHIPRQYTMSLADLNVGNAKMKKPSELRLRNGATILAKFLGTNPESGDDRFVFFKLLGKADIGEEPRVIEQ